MLKHLPTRPRLSSRGVMRIAIVASRYNWELVEQMLACAQAEIKLIEPAAKVDVVHAPGAFEIPYLARQVIEQKRPDAVICLGVIIRGETGHAEAIEIVFNPAQLSYRQLLEFFFQIHDPTTKNRQGNDKGTQYRSAIFVANEIEKTVAEEVIAQVNASGKWPGKAVTEVVQAGKFYEAEEYHQKYLELRPDGYTCHFIRPNWKL